MIERYEVPNVHERHYDGMFNPLAETIEGQLRLYRDKPGKPNSERLRFWEYALSKLDRDFHMHIQRKYLRDKKRPSRLFKEGSDGNRNILKYIDPVKWLESKLSLCQKMGLDKAEPMTILDIGTGGGQFPFVAHFCGHDVLGLDVPQEIGETGDPYFYDDLCQLHGVERVPFQVTAGHPLPDLGRRFDMVTACMAAFNVHWSPRSDGSLFSRPWTVPEWQFFIEECTNRWLKPGGRLVMTLAKEHTPDDCWAYLARHALQAEHDRFYIDLRPHDYAAVEAHL